MNIISTDIPYNSSVFHRNLQDLLKTYPFLKSQIIGYSVLGKPIYVISVGTGKKEVFYSASFHANEWITSLILMKFIEDISDAYVSNSRLFKYSICDLLNKVTIHLCPMVNPDGVDLVTGFIPSTSSSYILAKQISSYYPDIPFPHGWKANINGVDFKNYHSNYSFLFLYPLTLRYFYNRNNYILIYNIRT